MSHLSASTLFRSKQVAIGHVRCRSPRCGCTPEEHSSRHSIAFIRSGVFVKHLGREQVVADSSRVVFFSPNQPYRVSHPVDGGDECLTIAPARELVREALREFDPAAADSEDAVVRRPDAPAEPVVYLWQARLVRNLEQGAAAAMGIEEAVCAVVEELLSSAYEQRAADARGRASTAAAHRDLADAARVVLARHRKERLSLADVASEVHASPYHLSRVFHRQTGLTLQRHLNRLRLREALSRVADGEDLTRVALAVGFYDHSHFANAFRREFGVSPSGMRRDGFAQMSNAFQV